MSGERFESRSGSSAAMAPAHLGNLENMVKSLEPALRGAGRWNLEVVGLMTRRSQAWLGIPKRLGHCKSPVDLINEQMRFWQQAMTDYSEATHRLVSAFGATPVVPGLNGAHQRDYITFPETSDVAAEPKRPGRKAA